MITTRRTDTAASDSTSLRLPCMSTRGRRDYGSGIGHKVLYGRVKPEYKAKVDALADARRISQTQALELILTHLDVDASGQLSWTPPADPRPDQEVLPLNKSA